MPSDGPTPLRDLGISRDQSSQWQHFAKMPDEQFKAAFTDPETRPTTAGIIAHLDRDRPRPRIFSGGGLLRDNQNLCSATISDTSMSSIALPE